MDQQYQTSSSKRIIRPELNYSITKTTAALEINCSESLFSKKNENKKIVNFSVILAWLKIIQIPPVRTLTFAFSIQGQIAHAALACTCGKN